MTELKRALIIIPLSIIIIPLLILLAQGLYMWSDSPEEIAGKYLICYEPHFTLGIKTGESTWNLYDENMFIENIEHSDDFILIYALRSPNDILQSEDLVISIWNDVEKIKNDFSPALYIIDVKQDSIYGPMDIKEYVEMREKLGVPDDMTLKVKLKI